MFKLYGFSVSNYYNMVKLALLEKGLPFEEVTFYPTPTPESLKISPRGKVPVLGVEDGYINETMVMLEYIESVGKGVPLLPTEPFACAQVLAVAKEIELYIELPGRACYGEAFSAQRCRRRSRKRPEPSCCWVLLHWAATADSPRTWRVTA